MQDITLFTSQPKTKFYNELFSNIQFDAKIPIGKTSRKSYNFNAMLNAFIVIKTERFSQIIDLVDYLNNNQIIAHYCGFQRFLKNIDNDILKKVMQSQVLKLAELGYIDTSFIGLDSTPISANTKHNNPKTFTKNKFTM
ncbi:MAG: transposase [Bacillota bacterium]